MQSNNIQLYCNNDLPSSVIVRDIDVSWRLKEDRIVLYVQAKLFV